MTVVQNAERWRRLASVVAAVKCLLFPGITFCIHDWHEGMRTQEESEHQLTPKSDLRVEQCFPLLLGTIPKLDGVKEAFR